VTDLTRARRALARRRIYIMSELLGSRAVADLAVELAYAEPDLEALGLEGIEDELWAMLAPLATAWLAEGAADIAALLGGPVVAGPTWSSGPDGARASIARAIERVGQRYDELPPRVAAELYTRWVCEYEDAMTRWGLNAQ
jgi:hypothetical protein